MYLIKERYSTIFIIAIGLLVILPFVLLSFYIFPSADDFCFNIKTKELGYLSAQGFWYANWTGRYFATSILTIEYLVDEIWAYRIIPLLLILSFIASLYFFWKNLIIDNKKSDSVCLAIISLSFIIFQFPSIVQGFYWLPGSISYQFANILFLVFIVILIKIRQNANVLYSIIAIILIGAIIGCNETSMLYMNLSLVLFAILDRHNLNPVYWSYLCASVVFSSIVIFAPGNEIRSSMLPGNRDILFAFEHSFTSSIFYLMKWLPGMILITPLLAWYMTKKKLAINTKISINLLILITIGVFIVPVLGFFPGYWSLGGPPPLRTVNTIYFSFFISFMGLMVLMITFFSKNVLFFTKFFKIRYAFLIVGLLLIFNGQNIKTAYYDLISGSAKNYKAELDKRMFILSKPEGSDDLILPPLLNKPGSVFFDDLTENPEDWRNNCYSRYHGLDRIYINRELK